MDAVSTFVHLANSESVLEEWEMLDDPGTFQASDLLLILLGLALLVIPGLVAVWDVISRPPIKGTMVLTNWRLLYYERGDGPLRTHRRVDSINLEDIAAIHTCYSRGWFGLEHLDLITHTRHEDSFNLSVGDSGGILGKIPVLGRLFRRRTIGKDAFAAVPVLYRLARLRPGSSVTSGSGL